MSNELQLGFAWLPMVLKADYGVAASPFVHADRTLDFHVMLYITSGNMHIVEQDEEFYLEKGDLLLLKAGCRHYGIFPCEVATSWYYIHFHLPQGNGHEQPHPIQEMSPVGINVEYSDSDYHGLLSLPKKVHQPPGGQLEKGLKKIADLACSADITRFAHMGMGLYETLLTCFELFRENAAKDIHAARVEMLMAYMEAHTNEPFSATDISRHVGLSYKYISTQFRLQTGITLHAYHTRLRMDKAAALLRQTTSSISEISNELGFSEPFYFSNCFKKVYECSPKQYRLRHTNKT